MIDRHDEIETPDTPLDARHAVELLEATPSLVRRLRSVGLVDDEGRLAALQIVNGPLVWWAWVEKALLFVGLILVLAGIVCFFAWNWDALPGLVKLATMQIAIVACCSVGLKKGLDTLAGKAAQTAAAVLVGVFLAVFGQIYQTGADAYQLFVGWALLILPWVVMCRLAGLWLLWLTIVNLGITLYWKQVVGPGGVDWEWLLIVLGLVNGAAAAVRETLAQQAWSSPPIWLRWVLIPASLFALVCPASFPQGKSPAFTMIVDFNSAGAGDWAGLSLLILGLILLYAQFRLRFPDLFILTCGATTILALACAVVVRVSWEVGDEVLSFFLSGLAILGLVTLMARWLMRTAQAIRVASESQVTEGFVEQTAGSETANKVSEDVASREEQDRKVCVGELFSKLAEQGQLFDENAQAAYAILAAEAHEERTPWFVQGLIGLGAWISCLLFLVALAITGLFDEGAVAAFVGICLLAGGAVLDRKAEGAFFRQCGLAAGLTGFGLTGVGAEGLSHSSEMLCLTVTFALMTAVFYRPFNSPQFRFLTCLTTVTFAATWLSDWFQYSGSGYQRFNWGLQILLLLETCGIGLIFSRHRGQLLRPAGYAFAVGLLGTLLVTQFPGGPLAWPSAVFLAVAQIWVLRRAWVTSPGQSPKVFQVAAAGTALLGVLSLPGVLASLGATVLGHLERDVVLKGLGLLFL
ncbi:MAG: DUF4401 domain-containing protein, partial [Planctomycetota bacterium]|nr:DUF4401 domain-containing protein [Planctomycetota bacterium]